ncbi:MAG: ATP-binding protein [Gemmatimonadota bacterium]|jgi:uncharacterized protein (UPF0147 family)|nr:ATP-binding protein [Gemmatimonadota bacterium]
MKNPFKFGRELPPGDLVDRRTEVDEVHRVIRDGGKLFLIGPRRYGKSSILASADAEATRDGAVVLRFNAEAYPTVDLFAQALAGRAAQQLTGTVERAGEAIRRFFARLSPTATYNPFEQSWSVSLTASGGADASRTELLVDVLNGVHALARADGRRVGVIIDEFQQVVNEEGIVAERQIRAAVQQHEHVGYVFAGSATRLLTDMTEDPGRPFYRLGARRFIGPVPRADFVSFLRQGFASSGFTVASEAIDTILDLAEDVPHNVQRLAHDCWNVMLATEGGTLTPELVRATLEALVRGDDPFYTQIWNRITSMQQKALVAVVLEGGTELHSQSVLRRYGLAHSTMQKSLQRLQSSNIIRQEEALGSIRLRLEDPFFAAWIKLVVTPGFPS